MRKLVTYFKEKMNFFFKKNKPIAPQPNKKEAQLSHINKILKSRSAKLIIRNNDYELVTTQDNYQIPSQKGTDNLPYLTRESINHIKRNLYTERQTKTRQTKMSKLSELLEIADAKLTIRNNNYELVTIQDNYYIPSDSSKDLPHLTQESINHIHKYLMAEKSGEKYTDSKPVQIKEYITKPSLEKEILREDFLVKSKKRIQLIDKKITNLLGKIKYDQTFKSNEFQGNFGYQH